ncbi:amino acid adenylation domain-containing protein [Streptomyces yangpuensis]|uniref:amino acid adenylation domain-containing protein n=1 Tax=Streptomyces yangpuensis TaxID=1648182 RepID=UPI003800776A
MTTSHPPLNAADFETGDPVDCDSSINALMEEIYRRHPAALAVCSENGRLTYSELSRSVDAQAQQLITAGVKPGDVVVIALPRSLEELVAVLGTVRAGAVYTSIDRSAPDSRAAAMLARVEPRAVLGAGDEAQRLARLAPGPCAVVSPHEGGSAADCKVSDEVPDPCTFPAVTPEHPAYISFTSGSTGIPKAVVVPHRAVVRLARGASYLRRGPGERMLRLAPLAFDASTLELFCGLGSGATLEVFPDGPTAPVELAAFLNTRAVTVAWLTAGLFRLVADEAPQAFDGLRQLVTGGDVVPAEHVRQVLMRCPGLVVTNGYGPTENTTFSTTHTVLSADDVVDPLPIGRPVGGTRALVLGPDGRRVPVGEAGELYVAGSGLALGYLNAEGETSRAFVTSRETSERLYRTGDLVRWDEHGRLQFIGRADRQVKIRGFRVEPAEIEGKLRTHTSVRDVHVGVVAVDGVQKLTAVVVSDQGPELADELREHLRLSLPTYMIPLLWAVVPQMPVTVNGKVDLATVAARAAAEQKQQFTSRTDAPESEVAGSSISGAVVAVPAAKEVVDYEQLIADVWTDVLGTDDFDFDEAFFDVGGDSLLAGSVHTRLSEALPHHGVRVVDIFRYPTVQGLADHLRAVTE